MNVERKHQGIAFSQIDDNTRSERLLGAY